MTYARARLWTGITGVGSMVSLATWALVESWPARLFGATGDGLLDSAIALAGAVALGLLATLPWDVVGGFVLPKRFGRPVPNLAGFTRRWLRGLAVFWVLGTGSALTLLLAGRAGGVAAALLALAILAGLALQFQGALARLVGGLRRVDSTALQGSVAEGVVFAGEDPGFTGGFTGWDARPVWPASWGAALEPDQLELLAERRRQIRASGAWRRAQLAAIGWNVLGFGLATLLPGAGVATVAELLATALGFTLWTFVGLLLLPSISRAAARAADAAIARDEPQRSRFGEALRRLDRLQDDEPERSASLESIFHPVASVTNRMRAIEGAGAPERSTWHLARTALFLANLGLSLLPRTVHCNAGRPELWVYLPADG